MASVITPGPISQMVLTPGPFTGTERLPIIVPTTATLATFQNFGVTLAVLAAAVSPFAINPPTFITSGATTGSPYAATATDFQLLVNKSASAATGILLPNSATRALLPVLVKDLKGDAATFQIDVTFTGGQTCDGLSTYSIIGNYAWQWFYPLASGGWYAG